MLGVVGIEKAVVSGVIGENRSGQRTALYFQRGNNRQRYCDGAASESAEIIDDRYLFLTIV